MKKIFAILVVIAVCIIGGVYAYNSNNIEVSESVKHSIEYDTKTIKLSNNSSHKKLVQLEITTDIKTTFGNYQPMSVEYQEVIINPGEEKSVDIRQYHTRKVRWDIVKEVELK